GPGIFRAAGFSPREHLGRTIYLLAPGTPGTGARTGDAIAQLLPHTLDIVELAWTSHYRPAGASAPDTRITVCGTDVAATTTTPRAHPLLLQAGFTKRRNGTLQLADNMDEDEVVDRIVRTEAHLLAEGLLVRVDLGIATPDVFPPALCR
ncbi:hypothetical protein, partial [Streptomyces sp. WAC02707]|uniref:hypothetical protein n=1 Tax=Streptomyces sp. WAC02707 TaxID=2487417 RepID=UPI00163BE1F4